MPSTRAKTEDREEARTRGTWRVTALFLAWLALLLAFSFFTYATTKAYREGPGGLSASVFFRGLVRYDAAYYLEIARHGYASQVFLNGNGTYVSAAFWPLYPLLTKAASYLTAGNHIAAALAVTWLSLFLSLLYLRRLTLLESDGGTSFRACLYLLFFPTACFLFFPYAEALFLLCATAALYHARRSSWALAGLWCFLACLARPVGIAVCAAAALEALQQSGWKLSRLRPRMAPLLLAPLGLLAYPLYLRVRFGDFFYFAKAHREGWQTGLNPLSVFSAARHVLAPERLSEFVRYSYLLGFLLLFAALMVPAWRRLRPSLALYGTLCLVISALFTSSVMPLQSMNRHVIVVFPAFMILGLWGKSRDLERLYLAAGTLGLATFTAVYLMNFFSG